MIEPPPTAGREVRPLRVLILEDTPERQEILKSLYREHAWVLVHTGKRAITLLRAFAFDIVSLDYNLADELTGADVARAIHAAGGNKTGGGPRVVIHSLNPRGVVAIRTLLPDALVVPVSRIGRSNAALKRLRAGLATAGAAFDFSWRGR